MRYENVYSREDVGQEDFLFILHLCFGEMIESEIVEEGRKGRKRQMKWDMEMFTAGKIQTEEDFNSVSLYSLRLKNVIMKIKFLKDKEKG